MIFRDRRRTDRRELPRLVAGRRASDRIVGCVTCEGAEAISRDTLAMHLGRDHGLTVDAPWAGVA